MELKPGLDRHLTGRKIESVQVLRGIAALIVTVYHLKDLLKPGDPWKKELDFLFNSGSAGVNLFYVISGFIMVYITRGSSSRSNSVLRFVIKRFIRIWPVYAIITLSYYFLIHRFGGTGEDLHSLARSLAFIPLSPGTPPFYGYATLPVGWTLNYEIYFYFLVAVSMLFSRARWYVFFLLIAITLIGIPFSLGYLTHKPDWVPDYGSSYLNLMTNPIIWNFVSGVAIGLAFCDERTHSVLKQCFTFKWVYAVFLALGVWQYLSGFFGGLGILQWGAGASAVFLAFVFYHAEKNTPFPAWLVWLGDVSFSIYLLHLPVMVILTQVLIKLGYPIYSHGTAMLFLAVAMTLVASYGSHHYLETALANWLKKRIL